MVVILKTKEGEDKEIPWKEAQAAGDLVILKPKVAAPAAPAAIATCPTCRGPLTYIQRISDGTACGVRNTYKAEKLRNTHLD